jgi:hypothetical protein
MNNSFSMHVWHQIVERYIEASGIAWTHLHPNVFMENLLTFFAPRRGVLTVYWGEQRADWVALSATRIHSVLPRRSMGLPGGGCILNSSLPTFTRQPL